MHFYFSALSLQGFAAYLWAGFRVYLYFCAAVILCSAMHFFFVQLSMHLSPAVYFWAWHFYFFVCCAVCFIAEFWMYLYLYFWATAVVCSVFLREVHGRAIIHPSVSWATGLQGWHWGWWRGGWWWWWKIMMLYCIGWIENFAIWKWSRWKI